MAVDAKHGKLVTTPEIRTGRRADLDRLAADLIAQSIDERLREASHVVLGLVGGRSVGGIYEDLQKRSLPWDKLHVFLADERLVPVTSDESNWRLIEADLLRAPLADGRMPATNGHAFPVRCRASRCGSLLLRRRAHRPRRPIRHRHLERRRRRPYRVALPRPPVGPERRARIRSGGGLAEATAAPDQCRSGTPFEKPPRNPRVLRRGEACGPG